MINMYHKFKYEENNCSKLFSCVLVMPNKGCPVCYTVFGDMCEWSEKILSKKNESNMIVIWYNAEKQN